MKKSLYGEYEAAKLYARQLRKVQTSAEKNFWNIVKDRQISGKRFLRQFVMEYCFEGRTRFFITDFYCAEAKLIIEIDGGIHGKQKDYDTQREEILLTKGFRVLRFENPETEKPSFIVEKLVKFFK